MAKIQNVTKLVVIKKIANSWEKDGKSGKSFKLIVLQGDNSETLSCTEEVLNLVEEYKEYHFVTDYNTDYKSLRIVGLIDNNK